MVRIPEDALEDTTPRWLRERRKHPRVEIQPGMLRVSLHSLAEFLDQFALNISTGGMFIACPRPFPIGTRLRFRFDLGPEDPPFSGECEVRWVRDAGNGPKGIGVAFLDLDEAGRELVRRIVETQRQEIRG